MRKANPKAMVVWSMKIHLQLILLGASIIVCLEQILSFLFKSIIIVLSSYNCLILSDHDMRGYKITVGMAEKSAPRPPPAHGQG